MEPYIGEIRLFAWGFTPRGWVPCDGRILTVPSNQALYSLLANRYGGTPNVSFGIPDLRGRAILGAGQGADGVNYAVAAQMGTETVTLSEATLPAHTHGSNVATATGNFAAINGAVFAPIGVYQSNPTVPIYVDPGGPPVTLSADTVASTGAGAAHDNMQPFLAGNYCIALTGLYPMRP